MFSHCCRNADYSAPMHPRLTTVAAGAIVLLTTLALAGCGKSEIDVDKASQFIDDAVEKEVGAQGQVGRLPGLRRGQGQVDVQVRRDRQRRHEGRREGHATRRQGQHGRQRAVPASARSRERRSRRSCASARAAPPSTARRSSSSAKGAQVRLQGRAAGPTTHVSATQTDTQRQLHLPRALLAGPARRAPPAPRDEDGAPVRVPREP